jgi:SnoaL-like domain
MADMTRIQELMARYCYAQDSRDLVMLETCFTADATISGLPEGAQPAGRAGLMEVFGRIHGMLTARRRHMLTNFFFLEEGESEARVQAYETFYLIRGEELELHLTGIYRVRVAIEDGVWKIRHIEAAFDVPFEPGDLPGTAASQFE